MPLKITKRTVKRQIDLEDFIKMKDEMPFKFWRQVSKQVNFLYLFGGSAMVFAENALETAWTPEQCEHFMQTEDCTGEIKRVKATYKNISDEELPYVVVATKLRDRFFNTYPGLMDRIYAEKTYAGLKGYCRSVFGATRNTIELKLAGKDDQKYNSAMIRNLQNITSNQPIQNMEASISKRAMYDTLLWLDKNNMKSYPWNEIHDSADWVVHKSELKRLLSKIKYQFEKQVPECAKSPIKLKIDCEISDLQAGDYYKGGRHPFEFGIDWDNFEGEENPEPTA